MTKEELESLLRDKIPALPKKARKVAEYLLSNMREAAFRSIGEVANELNVSKAQLVRVSRILGFKGLCRFKISSSKGHFRTDRSRYNAGQGKGAR